MARILVVDDSRLFQAEIGAELHVAGYETISASTGREALKILKKEKVDAVVLDLVMPELEGIPTLEEMRRDPKTANIPVVVCTSHGIVSYAEQAVKLGAHFLSKPVDADRLIKKLRDLIK